MHSSILDSKILLLQLARKYLNSTVQRDLKYHPCEYWMAVIRSTGLVLFFLIFYENKIFDGCNTPVLMVLMIELLNENADFLPLGRLSSF